MIRNTPTILRISGEKKIKSWKLKIIITVEPLVVLALRHALKDDQRHKVRSDCQNVHDVHRVFQKATLLSCSSKPEIEGYGDTGNISAAPQDVLEGEPGDADGLDHGDRLVVRRPAGVVGGTLQGGKSPDHHRHR